MLVLAYPLVADAESIKFSAAHISLNHIYWYDSEKNEERVHEYLQFADSLSRDKGLIVFVGTGQSIIQTCEKFYRDACLCYPAPWIKDGWVHKAWEKMQDPNATVMDKAIYEYMNDHFSDDIAEFEKSKLKKIVITDPDADIIKLLPVAYYPRLMPI